MGAETLTSLHAPQLAGGRDQARPGGTADGTGDRLELCAFMDVHLGVTAYRHMYCW